MTGILRNRENVFQDIKKLKICQNVSLMYWKVMAKVWRLYEKSFDASWYKFSFSSVLKKGLLSMFYTKTIVVW